MKIKELIELLQQQDPEKEAVIEFTALDEFGYWAGMEHVSIESNYCKSYEDLFVIEMEDYKHL